MAAERWPEGGTGGPVGRPGSAVDRAPAGVRLIVTPAERAQHELLCIGHLRTTVQPEQTPVPNGIAYGVTDDRPNSTTAWIRTARPPSGGDRLRPACGARHCSTGPGGQRARRRSNAGTTQDQSGASRPPLDHALGREHTTPIVQTRGGASSHVTGADALVRTCFAASEPGSFGGPRRSAGRGPGTAGMATLPGVRRARRGPRRRPGSTRRHLGKRGGTLLPRRTPALGPAARESLAAASPSPPKV